MLTMQWWTNHLADPIALFTPHTGPVLRVRSISLRTTTVGTHSQITCILLCTQDDATQQL